MARPKQTLFLASVFVFMACAAGAQESVADKSLPPELKDLDLTGKKNGFVELFDTYNPNGFSVYSSTIGLRSKSGFEYYSTGTFYGQPGNAEPQYYRTKQNLYYELSDVIPLDLSAQAVYANQSYPIHRFGVRWKVSSTAGLKDVFGRLHLAYSVNLQPVQIDSIPGYNWQIEHIYQISFPELLGIQKIALRGVIDQMGGPPAPSVSYSSQLSVPVYRGAAAIAEYKYAPSPPSALYNGMSYGLEYRWSF